MTIVFKSGYLVSIISYAIFVAADFMRPGFVSNFMSAHIFLLAAVVFGVLWASRGEVSPPARAGRFGPYIIGIPLGFLLAFFAWKQGRSFAEFRFLVTLVAFLTPGIILAMLKTNNL